MSYITDTGLDNMGNYGINTLAGDGSNNVAWLEYLAVGTGAMTPGVGISALVNETHRSGSRGGFSTVSAITTPTGIFRRSTTFYRVINFSGSYNLTEWGLFPGSSGGSPSVVDRFREDPNDNGSAFVTISVQDGDQLQMIFTEVIDLVPYGAQANVVTITTDDTPVDYDAVHTVFSEVTSTDAAVFTTIWNPDNWSTDIQLILLYAAGATQTGVTEDPTGNIAGFTTTGIDENLTAYTNGTYYRDKEVLLATNIGNDDIYGFAFCYVLAGSNRSGFKTHFTSPASFEKLDTQELTVTLRVSWDRA